MQNKAGDKLNFISGLFAKMKQMKTRTVTKFRELDLDDRILVIKQFTVNFKLWEYQAQMFLTTQNPTIKIYLDNVCAFDDVNEFNNFFLKTIDL